MSKPLIVVTRPDPAGSALCCVLEEKGYDAVLVPTIAFTPPPDVAAMEKGISQLGEQDWVIFISPQAVQATVPMMRRMWPVMSPDVKFAAVGLGTAEALKEAGYHAIYPATDWGAEGLLAMAELNNVKGKQIAIVRGDGGREILEPVLRQRGAKVLSVVTYQRDVPRMNSHHDLFKQKRVDSIVFTSATSLTNLEKMVDEAAWEYIKCVPAVVVSDRIKEIARTCGFQAVWVARNASHEAIADTIKGIDYDRK